MIGWYDRLWQLIQFDSDFRLELGCNHHFFILGPVTCSKIVLNIRRDNVLPLRLESCEHIFLDLISWVGPLPVTSGQG